MSRTEKLLQRFLEVPKDFTWDELVTLLRGMGFTLDSGSGSRRAFRHAGLDCVFFFHEPHPVNVVKACYIRDTIKKLEELGILP